MNEFEKYDWAQRVLGSRAAYAREAYAAGRKAADAQTREAQVNLLGDFIGQAFKKSPDTFRGWPDAMRCAELLVRSIEGA